MRNLIALGFVLAVGCGEEEVGTLFQCQCVVACADGASATVQNTPHCYASADCAAAGFQSACADYAAYLGTCGASTPANCGNCACGGALGECAADDLLTCPN